MTTREITNGSPRRLTQAERTALSDKKMFEAATALILEKGTLNTTLKDIGERAKYSRGLASYRFGTKENLFRELLKRIERRWTDKFRAEMMDKRGLAAFQTTLKMFDTLITEDTAAYRAAMLIRFETVGSSPETATRTRRVINLQRKQVADWIGEALEDGELRGNIDPKLFAISHISFLYGTMYQLVLAPEVIMDENLVRNYFDAFIDCFGAPDSKFSADW